MALCCNHPCEEQIGLQVVPINYKEKKGGLEGSGVPYSPADDGELRIIVACK